MNLKTKSSGPALHWKVKSTLALRHGVGKDRGLEDPIGILEDCHRKMDRFLHVLWVVADRAAGRQLTSGEIESVVSALHYFSLNGQLHCADERDSLFPRLRAESMTGNSEDLCLLESNIRQTNRLYPAVDALYSAWILGGGLVPEDEMQLQSSTEKLKRLLQEHTRITEQIVFPRAVQLLDSRSIVAVIQEFRARRR